MKRIEGLIGNTPMVRLSVIERHMGIKSRLFAKLEKFNPTGSVKDRPALFMLNDLEGRGILKRATRIIEATSGNLGISLAFLGAVRGYKIRIIMPASSSYARRKMISSLGAELVLTDGGMGEAVALAKQMCDEGEGVCLSQFENPMNAHAHRVTTGPEIYQSLNGRVSVFVSGVGSGGTISGVGRYLKEKNPLVKIVATEPKESSILSGGKPGQHRIEGIGAGFLPTILDKNVINRVISADFDEAKECVKLLAEKEGLLLGISSGAALFAALSVAKSKKSGTDENIVILMPDGAEKYIVT